MAENWGWKLRLIMTAIFKPITNKNSLGWIPWLLSTKTSINNERFPSPKYTFRESLSLLGGGEPWEEIFLEERLSRRKLEDPTLWNGIVESNPCGYWIRNFRRSTRTHHSISQNGVFYSLFCPTTLKCELSQRALLRRSENRNILEQLSIPGNIFMRRHITLYY